MEDAGKRDARLDLAAAGNEEAFVALWEECRPVLEGVVNGRLRHYLRTLKKSFSSVAASVSPTAE